MNDILTSEEKWTLISENEGEFTQMFDNDVRVAMGLLEMIRNLKKL
tara:strand:- start:789 stop:926 length:138 start_codon:yes stop_codon:yes gene_type:complete